jgi:hypothetical protein
MILLNRRNGLKISEVWDNCGFSYNIVGNKFIFINDEPVIKLSFLENKDLKKFELAIYNRFVTLNNSNYNEEKRVFKIFGSLFLENYEKHGRKHHLNHEWQPNSYQFYFDSKEELDKAITYVFELFKSKKQRSRYLTESI